MAQGPPRYVLLSSGGPSNAYTASPLLGGSPFAHPASIHYHYADDPPIQLLPPGNDTILVMDVDDIASAPAVRSLSSDVVVTGVKVSQVPGVPSAAPDDMSSNPNMYVIDLAGREKQR